MEQEKEKQFVAQAMAGSMKHGGGGRDSRRGSMKPDEWQGGKGDRDRDRRDKDRDREKPKEKLDANRLKVLLKHREKSKDSGVSENVDWMDIYSALQVGCPTGIGNRQLVDVTTCM